MKWGRRAQGLEVLPNVDLLAVVRRYTALHPVPGGRRWEGLCPVHDDANPSLSVWPNAKGHGLWKCYPCNRGGDAADFVAWVEGVTRSEAIASLSGSETQALMDTLVHTLEGVQVHVHRPAPRTRVGWVEVVGVLSTTSWWNPTPGRWTS